MSLFARNNKLWRRGFWYGTFLGRVFSLALSGAVGGLCIGALLGVDNGISTGSFSPLWRWVAFTSVANAVWMIVYGLLVGLLLFAGVTAFERHWSKQRYGRFSLGMGKYVCQPLRLSLLIVSLLTVLVRFLVRPNVLFLIGVGNFLFAAQILLFPVVSLVSVILLAHRSRQKHKPSFRKKALLIERLLPTD